MGDAGLSSLISAHQMCNIRAKPVTSYRFAGLRHQCGFINCMKHSAPAGKETLGGDSYTKAGSTNPYTLCSIFQESKTTLKSNFLRTRFRKKKMFCCLQEEERKHIDTRVYEHTRKHVSISINAYLK